MSYNIFDQGSPAAMFAAVAAGAAMRYMAAFMASRERYSYVGRVSEIWVYPIKSFKGHSVQEAECTSLGMKWKHLMDRHWTVALESGAALTQRQEPKMVLITPTLIGDKMQLTAPEMEPITFPAFPSVTADNKSKVTVKKDTVDSVDCGENVADWLCRYFNRTGLRMHYSAPSLEKRDASTVKKHWKHFAQPGDKCAFSDFSGYLVFSKASLADLNGKKQKVTPVTNFRANIIVDDCGAFAEDSWSSLQIGDVQLRAIDVCTRCSVVLVNQETGAREEDDDPIETLSGYRRKQQYNKKICFGIYLTLDRPGKIKVGDPIYGKLFKN